MAIEQTALETVEYLVVVICPRSHKVLLLNTGSACGLPTVRVARRRRPAEQVKRAIEKMFGLRIFVIDFLCELYGSPHCALTQLLVPYEGSLLRMVPNRMISDLLSSEQELVSLDSLFRGASENPISQIGWIDQAILWVESATNSKLTSKNNLEQYNAGAGFSLVRFRMDDGRRYWLKATGEPNLQELHITRLLSELNPGCLPEFISYRQEWNAWLTSGGCNPIEGFPADTHEAFRFLEGAVESMALLQLNMRGRSQDLLAAGVFDQRMNILCERSNEIFDYLQEAMSLQVSIKAPRLEPERLHEMCAILKDVCRRTEDLLFPDTIVHGDLNCGNILIGSGKTQFIDWGEAYLSNPLISLQHLLLINKVEDGPLRAFINRLLIDKYRSACTASSALPGFDKAIGYMPILGIASALYGRGDWLVSPERMAPNRLTYARSLARHMDRALREQAFQDTYANN